MIQKIPCPDSIVTTFYSTEPVWRLLQHNLPGTDSCTDVEGTPRRWYGEDERTGRDAWCSEHRQHRLRIRERAWRTHSAHDPCLTSSEGDRHHFRFIISPYDAGELRSLRKFTRELMDQASRDLRGLTGHSGRRTGSQQQL
jgi:hypothetical protein